LPPRPRLRAPARRGGQAGHGSRRDHPAARQPRRSPPPGHRGREAQRYFDQGLALIYGFNHDAAIKSFDYALTLDPACAMCAWGKATALGPNINLPLGPAAAEDAYAAGQLALSLSKNATPVEQELIAAVAARYTPTYWPTAPRSISSTRTPCAGCGRPSEDVDVAVLTARL
jgi:hypothetical protein